MMKTFAFIFLSLFLVNCSPSTIEKLQELRQAANKVDNSKNFKEWHENKNNLNRLAFEDFQNEDPVTVCKGLEQWSDEELVRIEEMLFTMQDKFYCSSKLLARIENYNSKNIVSNPRRGNLTPCQRGPVKATLGPSEARVRDTKGGYRAVTGDLARCEIAFTFDDGPHATFSRKILDHLNKQNVTANYFFVGKNVDRLPTLTREIENNGQIWGTHSNSHPNLPSLSYAAGLNEIRKGFLALFKLTNYEPIPPFFRFPYGAHSSYLRGQLNQRNIAEFFWNMDSLDWKYKNADQLYANTLKEIEREKRGIILFHDIHQQTNAVIPRILEDLRLANYTSVFFVAKKNLDSFK